MAPRKITLTSLLVICVAALASAQLQVYMPREATISNGPIKLSQITILRGDPCLVERADTITLGNMIFPGQTIPVDRATILSRLATFNISASQVQFSGANSITVKHAGTTITGQEILQVAIEMARTQASRYPIVRIEPAAIPQDLSVDPNARDTRLVPQIVAGNASAGMMRVRVTAVCRTQTIASRDVLLRLLYKNHKIIATRDLPAGTVLTSEDVRIEEELSSTLPELDKPSPYGLVLKRAIKAGAQIRQSDLDLPGKKAVIKRNELVVVKIERPGIVVSSQGKALSDGCTGEVIKVRNIESNRIIICKVKDDGSVEPLL